MAQHAEATLQRISTEREPIVREIFRNLVTAQGTRAARSFEELLSVFGEQRQSAAEVLEALVQARLLSTYEVSAEHRGPGGEPRAASGSRTGGEERRPGEDSGSYARRSLQAARALRKVEIIHESLLNAWPRLVRWQTQDTEGALLRDQLRQAAQVWADRGKPPELLWSGASFRELQVWCERYPGRLSAVESAFVQAMTDQAARRTRRRRLAVGGIIVSLVLVLATMIGLYRNSEEARNTAEASRLLALGRLALDDNPSAAVAYALRSLELADDRVARRFALEALWQGPTAQMLDPGSVMAWDLAFSPDGRWLATGMGDFNVWLWPQDGGLPRQFLGHTQRLRSVGFTPDGAHLVSCAFDNTARVWTVPEGRCVRTCQLPGPGRHVMHPDGARFLTLARNEGLLLQSWPIAGGEPTLVARFPDDAVYHYLAIDPAGQRLALSLGKDVVFVSLTGPEQGQWKVFRHRDQPIQAIAFSPDGRQVAAADVLGRICLWSLSSASAEPEVVLTGDQTAITDLKFSPDGSRLASVSRGGRVRLWTLDSGALFQPMVLLNGKIGQVNRVAFHPSGRWMASVSPGSFVTLWPLSREYGRVSPVFAQMAMGLAFDPDGRWLVSSASNGNVLRWPLHAGETPDPAVLLESSGDDVSCLAADPLGRFLVMGFENGKVLLMPAMGGPARTLAGFVSSVDAVAVSQDGRLVAASGGNNNTRDAVIRFWDVDGGADPVRVLDPGHGVSMIYLDFSPDGRWLTSSGRSGWLLWDLSNGSPRKLEGPPQAQVCFSPDSRFVLNGAFPALLLHSVQDGVTRPLPAFAGDAPQMVDFDPRGEWVASGDANGVIQLGPVSGEAPHLLLGHTDRVDRVVSHPNGQWLATSSNDNTLRLWPVPHGQPFHTLPYAELLARLRSLTNYRVVQAPQDASGYRLELAPAPGWATVPTW